MQAVTSVAGAVKNREVWSGGVMVRREEQIDVRLGRTSSRRVRVVRCGLAEPTGKPAPMGEITRYNDSPFDKAFMALFGAKMRQITGKSTQLEGYEGFVDISKKVMQGRTALEQRAAVRQVLLSILPPKAPETFRKLFPPTKWSAEVNAAITVPFFQWLVGPCELMEVEDFFTNDFGLPLTMTPNFDDMSCEMVYGQKPLPLEEDTALKQPCYASLCSMAPPKSTACPRLPNVSAEVSLGTIGDPLL